VAKGRAIGPESTLRVQLLTVPKQTSGHQPHVEHESRRQGSLSATELLRSAVIPRHLEKRGLIRRLPHPHDRRKVVAELTIDGATSSGDQVVDFLGGGESQELTFVFADDPADGELVINVTGYAKP
jgi:hypothetical protein